MDTEFDLPTPDELIASAARFLIEGGEDEAASLILACNVDSIPVVWEDNFQSFKYGVAVNLRGPRVAYDVLSEEEHPISQQVRTAVAATLEHNCSLSSLNIRAERMTIAPDWPAELVEMARGVLIHNQAATAEKSRL